MALQSGRAVGWSGELIMVPRLRQAGGRLDLGGRIALVHVGLEKTGSTAIQWWLEANRRSLGERGIYVPKSLGARANHLRLVAACLDDHVVDSVKAHILRHERLSEDLLRRWVQASLRRELLHAPPWHTLMISSELISSRLCTHTELERLVALLRPHVSRLRFLLVLRRQDELAVSRFSTVLKAGYPDFDGILEDLSAHSFVSVPHGRSPADDDHFYDFERIVRRFSSIPDSDLLVRVYGEQPPVDMMADVLGVGPIRHGESVLRVNSAMSAAAQSVIARLNERHCARWPSGLRRAAYLRLLRQISEDVGGAPRLITRSSAERFLARYREGNLRLINSYGLPARLAADRLEGYPDAIDYGDLHVQTQRILDRYHAMAQCLPHHELWCERFAQLWRGLRHRARLLRSASAIALT